ncbi:MAG: M42 family metallopeptidase [Spirochaetes bacterium]|nr:M42 family metallopeptidase [Spirochaetota bacterium]
MKYLEQIIEDIMSVPSITGFEDFFAQKISSYIKDYFDSYNIDRLGNLILFKKGKGKDKLKIMFCAHMDQIGLMITKIEDNGILRFAQIGGINPLTLYGKRVKIIKEKNKDNEPCEYIYGIIGMKPPHLVEDESKVEKIQELFIDCGFSSKDEAQKKIKIGDVALVDSNFLKLKNNHYSSIGFDNKAGVLTLISLSHLLKDIKPYHDVYIVFSVQEEVGLRGARVSTFSISPDVAIVCDVTFGDPKGNITDVKTGAGPVIAKGPNYHPSLVSSIENICSEEDIPYQTEVESRPGGTDAYIAQITKSGVFTSLISIPLRYMHTQVEIISLKDIYRASKIMYFISIKEKLFEVDKLPED